MCKKRECVAVTWIILNKALVEISQLIGTDVTAGVIGRLEVQVIFSLLVEFRGCHIHADHNLIRVSCFGYGLLQQLQSCREALKRNKMRHRTTYHVWLFSLMHHVTVKHIMLNWWKFCFFKFTSNLKQKCLKSKIKGDWWKTLELRQFICSYHITVLTSQKLVYPFKNNHSYRYTFNIKICILCLKHLNLTLCKMCFRRNHKADVSMLQL